MQIKALLDAQAELTHNAGNHCPVVLSTRVRLARNIAEKPFPGWAKAAQRRDILSACFEALHGSTSMEGATEFRISDLTDLERLILVERHLISRELSQAEEGTGVVISGDQSCSVMINEEDHLRVQMLRSGFHFKKLWKSINQLDDNLEQNLDFAFSPELGYLTACPTNLGTAMRASAMMHLPALVLGGHMEKVVRAVNQLGLAVRGLFGEGSDASGSIFQISNQQTLGESEEQILERLGNVLTAVIEQESNAREKLLEDEKPKLLDKIARANGILRSAHLLSSAEAMNLLSLMRLAIDLETIPEEYRSLVDRLFIESQPGHIQLIAKAEQESNQRDTFRAQYVREQFATVPEPVLNRLNLPEEPGV